LPKFSLKNLNPSFKIFLIFSIIFAIGNSSDTFLILKAKNLSLTTILAIFAYALFNLFYAIFSTPVSILGDKIGPQKLILIGWFLLLFIFSLVLINPRFLFGCFLFFMAFIWF